jgi:hypothetical protein
MGRRLLLVGMLATLCGVATWVLERPSGDGQSRAGQIEAGISADGAGHTGLVSRHDGQLRRVDQRFERLRMVALVVALGAAAAGLGHRGRVRWRLSPGSRAALGLRRFCVVLRGPPSLLARG